MTDHLSDTVLTTPDPPTDGIHNPIHDASGADAAGYAGALVAGVRTYGWAAATIARALGESWLDHGWVDYRLRRPLYAGESLNIVVEREAQSWAVTCSAGEGAERRVVLDGTAGHENAPWLSDLQAPEPMPAEAAPASRPGYDLDGVPLNQPLRPLGAYVTPEAARNMVLEDLHLADEHYIEPVSGSRFVHPYFLPVEWHR